MKKHLLHTLLVLLAFRLSAQNPHQQQPPPLNNFPFTRGMFVDCSQSIVNDVRYGNNNGMLAQLKSYIRSNYINYIALSDLDKSGILGNSALETVLQKVIVDLKQTFPALKIGVVGKMSGYTAATPTVRVKDYYVSTCSSINGRQLNLTQLDTIVNSTTNLQRSETLKFFLRLLKFSTANRCTCPLTYKSLIDVFYLDAPYWKNANATNYNAIRSAYNDFENSLLTLQLLKCRYTNLTIEAEFQPTDLYWSNGWTATDQIEAIDPLVDRMMIPFYTNGLNVDQAFDVNCRLLHLLSDRFSKDGTKFYAGFSAQSPNYNYCNSTATPENHLGDYLNGIGSPVGNMASVENKFLLKLNDAMNWCSSCSCRPYSENQYSSTNLTANQCDGSMWYTYTMMSDHNLFRMRGEDDEIVFEKGSEKILYKLNENKLHLSLSTGEEFSYSLMSIDGRYVNDVQEKTFASITDISDLSEGLYVVRLNTKGTTISRLIPVHHR